jgi:hypothetical protein
MQMRHINTQAITPAADCAATGASCRQKPFGLLRSDADQALAGGCSR